MLHTVAKVINRIIRKIRKNPLIFSISLLVAGILIFSLVLNHKNQSSNVTYLVNQEFNTHKPKSETGSQNSDSAPMPTNPNNWAEMSAPIEESYNPQEFGVYSPQLENKTVEKIKSKYKGALITSRYATVDDIRIVTWTIDKQTDIDKIDLPSLPVRLLTKESLYDNYYDFPILDGYEWWPVVTDEKFISSRLPENITQDNIHKSKNGFTMYKKLSSCPRAACGVKIEFHTFTDNGKRQLFITLGKPIDYYNKTEEELNNNIEKGFEELQNFADTLTLEN